MIPDTPNIDLSYALKLTPAEAVDYFKHKGMHITDDWRDLWQEAHTHAFTVSKMAKHDLLVKTRSIIDRKLAQGLTERQAAAELKDEFIKAGWWRNQDGSGGPGTPWRIKTILRTNTLTAYAAGRHRRQKENAAHRPWWRYVAIQDSVTRDSHRALHGKILRHDDPAWDALYPPNGFNCRCRVISMTDKQAARAAADARLTGEAPEVVERPVGRVDKATGEVQMRPVSQVKLTDGNGQVRWFLPDAGWGYRPGARARLLRPPGRIIGLDPDQPGWEDYGPPSAMKAFESDPELLPDSAIDTPTKTWAALRAAYGIKDGSRLVGTPKGLDDVVIYDSQLPHLFEGADKSRARWARYLLPTLERPNEVWMTGYLIEGARQREYRQHYIKAWKDKSLFVVVTADAAGNLFYNYIPMSDEREINKRRRGALLYRWTDADNN